MAGEALFDAPSLLHENDEVVLFVSPVTFGYLYLITGSWKFLVAAIIVLFSAVGIVLDDAEGGGIDQRNFPQNIAGKLFRVLFVTLPFVVGLPAGIWFLYDTVEITPDKLLKLELISITLMLTNFAVLFSVIWIEANRYYE